MSRRREALEMAKGAALLLVCHIVAVLFILALAYICHGVFGKTVALMIFLGGTFGFVFWQLIWVIPLSLWLERKGKAGMVRGVILGATLTAFLNGSACVSSLF